jgi:hypothetical protein
MEAVRTFKLSVYFKETTRRDIPEIYHFHFSSSLKYMDNVSQKKQLCTWKPSESRIFSCLCVERCIFWKLGKFAVLEILKVCNPVRFCVTLQLIPETRLHTVLMYCKRIVTSLAFDTTDTWQNTGLKAEQTCLFCLFLSRLMSYMLFNTTQMCI